MATTLVTASRTLPMFVWSTILERKKKNALLWFSFVQGDEAKIYHVRELANTTHQVIASVSHEQARHGLNQCWLICQLLFPKTDCVTAAARVSDAARDEHRGA